MKVKLAFCMGKLRLKWLKTGISAAHTCTTYYRQCLLGRSGNIIHCRGTVFTVLVLILQCRSRCDTWLTILAGLTDSGELNKNLTALENTIADYRQ